MSKAAVYKILATVKANGDTTDKRGLASSRPVRTPEVVEAVKAYIEADQRVTYEAIQEAFGLSAGTINLIITVDLGLAKKSARWVPKLLSEEQKLTRLQFSRDFCRRAVTDAGLLNKIVTMDESAVSFHTPETKAQSKQWLPKGAPGQIKARVHASRKKTDDFGLL